MKTAVLREGRAESTLIRAAAHFHVMRITNTGFYMSSIAFACFECRIAMKREHDSAEIVCPRCEGTMYAMGWSFHAPPKKDVEQWKKVQWLFAEGFRFFGSGWGKGISLPERLRDVEKFLEEHPNHSLRAAKRIPELLPQL